MFRLFTFRLLQQIALVLLVAPGALQAQPILTLEEAIQEVIQNNKALQQARNSRQIDAYDNHFSKSDFFPTLTLPSISAEWAQKNIPSDDSEKGRPQQPSLGLSWKLAPSSLFSYQTLHVKDQISELKWQQKLTEKIEVAIKAYYSLVLAQQKLKVGVEHFAVAQDTLQLAKAKYETGQETELDYLDAQVTYDKAHADFLHQKEAMAHQRQVFCELLGRDQLMTFQVAEEIPVPGPLSWEVLWDSYQTVGPALILAQKQYAEQCYSLQAAQADASFPSFGVKMGYRPSQKKFYYGVNFTLDFSTMLSYAVSVPRHRLQLKNNQLMLHKTQVNEKIKLQKDFLAYNRQLQACRLQQRSTQISQARAAEALEKYRLGTTSLLDLKKQQEAACRAVQEYLQMCYSMKEKEISLRAMAGMPLES